jgi:hypothetical protein
MDNLKLEIKTALQIQKLIIELLSIDLFCQKMIFE